MANPPGDFAPPIAASGDVQAVPLGPQIVTALQGRPVLGVAPKVNQELAWNGQAWAPSYPAAGGVSTQTPGAVATVTIPHGLGVVPSWYTVQPASVNARGAPAYHLTADATNVTLNFASNLTAATAYAWVWSAHI